MTLDKQNERSYGYTKRETLWVKRSLRFGKLSLFCKQNMQLEQRPNYHRESIAKGSTVAPYPATQKSLLAEWDPLWWLRLSFPEGRQKQLGSFRRRSSCSCCWRINNSWQAHAFCPKRGGDIRGRWASMRSVDQWLLIGGHATGGLWKQTTLNCPRRPYQSLLERRRRHGTQPRVLYRNPADHDAKHVGLRLHWDHTPSHYHPNTAPVAVAPERILFSLEGTRCHVGGRKGMPCNWSCPVQ